MHTRVVRFTDVTPERMEDVRTRIEEAGGPPPGVDTVALTMLYDADQQTAIVLQQFSSAQDMSAAEEAFASMSAEETPGSRASVDRCAQVVEMRA
jgi:hypothetical protein